MQRQLDLANEARQVLNIQVAKHSSERIQSMHEVVKERKQADILEA
jgi:hypothetical protein